MITAGCQVCNACFKDWTIYKTAPSGHKRRCFAPANFRVQANCGSNTLTNSCTAAMLLSNWAFSSAASFSS